MSSPIHGDHCFVLGPCGIAGPHDAWDGTASGGPQMWLHTPSLAVQAAAAHPAKLYPKSREHSLKGPSPVWYSTRAPSARNRPPYATCHPLS